MAQNDFIGFASLGSANIMSQADYAAAAEQGAGVQPGMASSKLANKVWRQGANMAAALGEMIKAQGIDALDNGDIATLSSNIVSALLTFLLPLSGGTMAGAIISNSTAALRRPDNTSQLTLVGGSNTSATSGAKFILAGAEYTNSGVFTLQAGNSNGYKQFIGKPDGTLTWDSLPLVCGEFFTDHCKLNNKIEMECGYVDALEGQNVVTYKRAFTLGATPRVFVQPWAANAVENVNVYALSTTGFNFYSSRAIGVLYFAISLVG